MRGCLQAWSLLDQKTGKASKKTPRLLTARQAAIVEVNRAFTRRDRTFLLITTVNGKLFLLGFFSLPVSGETRQRSVR
jgi:hypothetical protein